MRAQVVIGGMFGDEGKGLMTDALAFRMMQEKNACTVVRYNGGAQAGHTVHTPQGVRHVFHHLGSGAFAGARTYLSSRFVAHPMLFIDERKIVAQTGGNTEIAIDPRCMITTPYDVMVNQAVERSRGRARHGSCGVGFGETVERNENSPFFITAGSLHDLKNVADILDAIRTDYLPRRLANLGVDPAIMDPWRMHDGVFQRFLEDAAEFLHFVQLATPSEALSSHVVFEGAQGLALDEELGYFPYVTRSKTGLPYLLDVCNEARISQIDVHYGTRAYTTRHGAGPMEFEDNVKPPGFEDMTNQPNDFQGSLRFSPLNSQKLSQLVNADIARADHDGVEIEVGAFVSCVDQMGEATPIAGGGTVPTHELSNHLQEQLGSQWISESHGPTRRDVRLSPSPSTTPGAAKKFGIQQYRA